MTTRDQALAELRLLHRRTCRARACRAKVPQDRSGRLIYEAVEEQCSAFKALATALDTGIALGESLGKPQGRHEERDAVVSWLFYGNQPGDWSWADVADAIRAGDHLNALAEQDQEPGQEDPC